jgi:hypothetical protein
LPLNIPDTATLKAFHHSTSKFVYEKTVIAIFDPAKAEERNFGTTSLKLIMKFCMILTAHRHVMN